MWQDQHQAPCGPMWQGMWGQEVDPVIQAGGLYILNKQSRYVRPGVTFARAAEVFEPQDDGSLSAYSGAQVPWGTKGVRLDPGWVQAYAFTHDFSTGGWGKVGANAPVQGVLGPNGLMDAWSFTEDTSAGPSHWMNRGLSATVGTPYTQTVVFSDRTGNRFLQIIFTSSQFGSTQVGCFDPRSGTFTLSGGCTGGMLQLANGYWMAWITAVATATAIASPQIRLSPSSAASPPTYTGDGVSGLNLWSANATNTPYPVPITKADSLAVTIPNFSFGGMLADAGIVLGSEYTIGVEYTLENLSANYQPISVSLSNNTFNDSIYQNAATLTAGREPNWAVIDEGVGQANSMGLGPAAVVGQLRKAAVRVRPNDFRSAFNGSLTLPDTVGTLPTVDRIYVGLNWSGTAPNAFQGSISKLWIVPTVGLSDSQLQAITA